jgi:hypothetical protein
VRRIAGTIGARLALSLLFLSAPTVAAQAHAGASGLILLLPTELYILGGAAAVLASFLVLTLFHRSAATPSPVEPSRRVLPRWFVQSASLFSMLFLAFLVAAGWFGSPDPIVNPLPTTVWTVWWAGFTLLVALFGDLWAFANPWIGLTLLMPRRALLRYPERLGTWPAILQFLGFAWFELIYTTPEDPQRLAMAVSAYWLINLIALLVFGPRWLQRGEAFSVFFAMVGRLSPRTWRLESEPELAVTTSLGPPARWLRQPMVGLSGAAFVLLTLSSVSFDGLSRTFWWVGTLGLNPLEYPGRSAVTLQNTTGLVLAFLTLGGLYAAAIALGPWRMGLVPSLSRALSLFVLSIVPISIAYHIAHYLQSLIVGFPSAVLALGDPFGLGWSLLPNVGLHHGSTMGLGPDGIINAYRAATALIVIGHIMAAWTAHRIALSLTSDRRKAVLSQIPLTVLMIGYTLFGLWLLSTPEIG